MPNRPSSEQIRNTLLPKQESTTEIEDFIDADFDFSQSTFLAIPLSKIQFYEKNPRRSENPNYFKIKESIANAGLTQPLVVTRRPGEKDFIIYKGGNTRLKAIQELFQESGDRKYRLVSCSYIPWSGFESDALVGHLQENEMRKSLCFIDKAHGVNLAIELLQSETEDELSLRQCQALLVEKGYSVTLSSLSIMVYAADTVEPNLPRDISSNLGRPQIQKLQALHNAFDKVCEEFESIKQSDNFIFHNTLKTFSRPDWSLNVFRRSLEGGLAEQTSISIHDISLRIDGYLNLSQTLLDRTPDEIYKQLSSEENSSWEEKMHHFGAKQGVYTVNTCTNLVHHNPEPVVLTPSHSIDIDKNFSKKNGKQSHSSTDPERSEIEQKVDDLRKQMYQIAWKLAKQHGFHQHSKTLRKIISKTGDWGIGFLVIDYPPQVSNLNLTKIGIRDALWWYLVECCDLQWAIECARPLTAKMVGSTDISNYVRTGDIKTLIQYAKGKMKCSQPQLGLIHFCLRQLDQDSWNDVRDLAEIYRSLHQIARSGNIHLFQLNDKKRREQ